MHFYILQCSQVNTDIFPPFDKSSADQYKGCLLLKITNVHRIIQYLCNVTSDTLGNS